MACCVNFVSIRNHSLERSFKYARLRSKIEDLGDGTKMHCWVPKCPSETKPSLLLLHGVGGTAVWQWSSQVGPLGKYFNLYVPDLLFFGRSFTTRPERTEHFQAQCVKKMMEILGVNRFSVVGLSYGGFVAYSLAHSSPDAVQKVIIVGSGVCLEEKDLEKNLLVVSDMPTALSILLPQTVTRLKELLNYALRKPPKMVPSCCLQDYLNMMNREGHEDREQLLRNLISGRNISDLPVLQQDTFIIWGEADQVFPLELANRLKSHLGGKAELVILKKTGHAINLEKPDKLNKLVKEFLLRSKND